MAAPSTNANPNTEFSLFSSRTHGITVHQERPSDVEWSLWRKTNRIWSDPTGEFYQPLGDWIVELHCFAKLTPQRFLDGFNGMDFGGWPVH